MPLDHDKPGGRQISLALVRLPASDRAHRIGSLFVNPGGPGTSGVGMVLDAATAARGPFSDAVMARFDVVGFDPRGIHASAPLLCFASLEEALTVVPAAPFPVTAREEQRFEQADRNLNTACQQHGGAIVDHMATADVARDLDLLRAAVGDRRLTFAGYSYGSFLGLTYANLFPRRVRALVLDGVIDPLAWTTGRDHQAQRLPVYNRLHSDVGAEATLNEFFRLCDAAGVARCALAGNAAQRFAALADRMRTSPAAAGEADFGYAELIKATWDALNVSTSWQGFARFLAELESTNRVPADETSGPSARVQPSPVGVPYPNVVEGNPGVLCSESDNPGDHTAWVRAGAAAGRRHGYFGPLWTWFSSVCATWRGFDADRYTGPFDRVTANPVLLVGTRFDPATPYRDAVTVHRLVPRSVLLTVDGWGHTSAEIPSGCATRAVSKYLLTGAAPRDGSHCAADATPFDMLPETA